MGEVAQFEGAGEEGGGEAVKEDQVRGGEVLGGASGVQIGEVFLVVREVEVAEFVLFGEEHEELFVDVED